MSDGYTYYSDRPRFVDRLAVELVVQERRYMKLTTAERQHAVHGLSESGQSIQQIGLILRITDRTVSRILDAPPPPMLDVNEDGQYVTEDGDVLHNAVECDVCGNALYRAGLCKRHREEQLAEGREDRRAQRVSVMS